MNEIKEPDKCIFSGIQPFTTIDDFGHVGAILFTGGCNFRCFYCHNPGFVLPDRVKFLPKDYVLKFLNKRKGLVESIIICGGEPTIHPNLIEWIKYIKELGYRVKLDTNATNTSMFRKIIDEKLVDFIAVDFKATVNNYNKVIVTNFDSNIVYNNLEYMAKSGIDYEIRTTIHSDIHDKEEILTMIEEMKKIGVKNYYLQLFKMPPESVGKVGESNFVQGFFDDIKIQLEKSFEKTGIRNLD